MSAPSSRKAARARARALAALVLAGVVALALWYVRGHWVPSRTTYPVQGLWLDAGAGAVDWGMVRATGPAGHGADFVYLTASTGADQRDPAFAGALDAARAAGLQVGAVHVYDLCAPGDAQAGNFVTTVPRDRKLLPAAIAFDIDPRTCPQPPGEAQIESELTTFLNQVERHLARPVILMPSRAAEERYHLAARIDRNVWVAGNWWVPGYVARPWVLWTATDRLHVPGIDAPVRWVVVQP